MNGHEIIALFEKWSPKRFAMEGDPVGLHIGQLNRTTSTVLVTLDVNQDVVEEAIKHKANLIIAHHPPLFRPLKAILTDTPQGRMIETCIKNEISVYAAHTNLDVASGGVNDLLASKLGLEELRILEETASESFYKLVVYCPSSHADQIRKSMKQQGAGDLGAYAGCSFTSTGTGRFTPSDGAAPFIGQIGKEESVVEERIEVLLSEQNRGRVTRAMLSSHPYEEPAYEVSRVEQPSNSVGLGRVGNLPEEMTLAQFANYVKKTFDVPALRFIGDPNKVIRKVAVLGGDGNKYIYAAKKSGADVLVTGDLYYHVAHDAEAMGLAVVDPGHNIEKIMIEGVASYLKKECATAGYDVQFVQSSVITEPFNFI